MIRGFWQSRLAFLGISAATLALAVAVWIRDRAYPIYVPILASLLTLAIGLVAARLLGNVIANQCNTKALGILHVDMDPKKFLEKYKTVPDMMKKDSAGYVLARAYLADGYAADGDFLTAMQTLCPVDAEPCQKDIALRGLYYNNYCRYALGAGDLAKAEEAAAGLEIVVNGARVSKPALSANLAESLRLHRNQIACITGEPVEQEWLTEQMEKAAYLLRRMDAAQALAQDAMNRGDTPKAREYLRILSREGGKTYFARWASRQENRLGK